MIKAEKRPLLVVLSGNTEMDYNLMDLVDNCWSFNKEHHFISNDDLKNIVSDELPKYTILSLNMVVASVTKNKFFRFSVYLGEKHRKKTMFYVDVYGFYKNMEFQVKRKDIIFALKYIQNHFLARKAGILRMGCSEVRKHRGELPTKTLLLDSALFDKKLDTIHISQNYTLPYKVTGEKEIEEALINNDGKYACVEIVPIASIYDICMHYVIDCDNCNIISYGGNVKSRSLINKRYLRLYQENGKSE